MHWMKLLRRIMRKVVVNFFIVRFKWVVYSLSFLFHKRLYILQKQPTRPIQVLLAFKWVLENSFLVKLEAGGAWTFAGNDLLQKFSQRFSVNFNPNKDGLFEGTFCWGEGVGGEVGRWVRPPPYTASYFQKNWSNTNTTLYNC